MANDNSTLNTAFDNIARSLGLTRYFVDGTPVSTASQSNPSSNLKLFKSEATVEVDVEFGTGRVVCGGLGFEWSEISDGDSFEIGAHEGARLCAFKLAESESDPGTPISCTAQFYPSSSSGYISDTLYNIDHDSDAIDGVSTGDNADDEEQYKNYYIVGIDGNEIDEECSVDVNIHNADNTIDFNINVLFHAMESAPQQEI